MTLSKIAETLDVPTAYFYAENDDLAELICLFDRANFDMQQQILHSLRSLNNR